MTMTNAEYIKYKYQAFVDEEYQNYVKSFHIPSKDEWLKMEHKIDCQHKLCVGDKAKIRNFVDNKIIPIVIKGIDNVRNEYWYEEENESKRNHFTDIRIIDNSIVD